MGHAEGGILRFAQDDKLIVQDDKLIWISKKRGAEAPQVKRQRRSLK